MLLTCQQQAFFCFWNFRSFWWRPFLLCKTMMLFLGNLMAFLSSSIVLRSQLMIHWHPSFFCLFVLSLERIFLIYFLRERLERERKCVCVCLKKQDFFETRRRKKNYYPTTIFLYPTKFIQWPARDRWCSVFKKKNSWFFLSWNSSIEEKKKKKNPNPHYTLSTTTPLVAQMTSEYSY